MSEMDKAMAHILERSGRSRGQPLPSRCALRSKPSHYGPLPSILSRRGRAVILRPEPPVLDDARVAAKAASVTRNPWFSMAQRSRLKPLLRQTQGCRNESRLAIGRAPASNLFCLRGGRRSRGKPRLPYRSFSPLLGPPVRAGPLRAVERYPNLRSLEGKSQSNSAAQNRTSRLKSGFQLS
jgi:hypothetical protein